MHDEYQWHEQFAPDEETENRVEKEPPETHQKQQQTKISNRLSRFDDEPLSPADMPRARVSPKRPVPLSKVQI